MSSLSAIILARPVLSLMQGPTHATTQAAMPERDAQLIIFIVRILISIRGLSSQLHGVFSIFCTTSIPWRTRPKTVCLLSSHGQGTVVTKNCDPLVLGPALAIDNVKGLSCFKDLWNSSSNSPPQMLSPPVPSPCGSPH